MYSQLLQNYENVKDDYTLVRKRYDDLVASHSDAVSKLEHSQVRPKMIFKVSFSIKGVKTKWVQVWANLIRFAIYAVKSNQTTKLLEGICLLVEINSAAFVSDQQLPLIFFRFTSNFL